MTYRIYYYIKGAPDDRPGGPWWYRDFDSEVERNGFLEGMLITLYKFALVEGTDLPVHDRMDIYPPEKNIQWGCDTEGDTE